MVKSNIAQDIQRQTPLILELYGKQQSSGEDFQDILKWWKEEIQEGQEDAVILNEFPPESDAVSGLADALKSIKFSDELVYDSRSASHQQETSSWLQSIISANRSVSNSVLGLFLCHTWNKGTPYICQSDLNGKRFTAHSSEGGNAGPMSKTVNAAVAIPYKVIDENRDGAIKVLPMCLKDTKKCKKKESEYPSAVPVERDDIVDVFRLISNSKGMAPPMESSGNLTLALIQYMDVAFGKLKDEKGWSSLLTKLARATWGSSFAKNLRSLRIPKKHLSNVVTTVFASRVSLKLGFLIGESVVGRTHSKLITKESCQNIQINTESSLQVLELKNGTKAFPQNKLKEMSNQLFEEGRKAYEGGSLLDFVRAIAAKQVIDNRKSQGRFRWAKSFPDNDSYEQNMSEQKAISLDVILSHSLHNPHLKKIINEYKSSLEDDSTIDNEALKEKILDAWNKDVPWLSKWSLARSPKSVWWVLNLHSQFADGDSALSLLELLDKKGEEFLPSGATDVASFIPYIERWAVIHECRIVLSNLLIGAYVRNHRGKSIPSRKVQKDRLARRVSPIVFRIVGKYGLSPPCCRSSEVKRKYPSLFKELQKPNLSKKDLLSDTCVSENIRLGNLSIWIWCLFKAIEMAENDDGHTSPPITFNLDSFEGVTNDNIDSILLQGRQKLFLYKPDSSGSGDPQMACLEQILDNLFSGDNEHKGFLEFVDSQLNRASEQRKVARKEKAKRKEKDKEKRSEEITRSKGLDDCCHGENDRNNPNVSGDSQQPNDVAGDHHDDSSMSSKKAFDDDDDTSSTQSDDSVPLSSLKVDTKGSGASAQKVFDAKKIFESCKECFATIVGMAEATGGHDTEKLGSLLSGEGIEEIGPEKAVQVFVKTSIDCYTSQMEKLRKSNQRLKKVMKEKNTEASKSKEEIAGQFKAKEKKIEMELEKVKEQRKKEASHLKELRRREQMHYTLSVTLLSKISKTFDCGYKWGEEDIAGFVKAKEYLMQQPDEPKRTPRLEKKRKRN